MNFYMKISLLLSLSILIGFSAMAGAPAAPPPAGVPLDGGLTALLAGGLAYGARKVYQARKQGE